MPPIPPPPPGIAGADSFFGASVIMASVWRGFPFWVISFLAALQNVPQELYETAVNKHVGNAGYTLGGMSTDSKGRLFVSRGSSVEVFQGPHFSRPEPLPAAEIPTSTAAALRLMGLARDPSTPERELELALLDRGARTATAVALADSTLLVLDRDDRVDQSRHVLLR